jgi:hypothetical protein
MNEKLDLNKWDGIYVAVIMKIYVFYNMMPCSKLHGSTEISVLNL